MEGFFQKLKAGLISSGVWALMIFSVCNPNQDAALKRFAPAADEAIATNYIALLRQSRFEPIQKDLDPSLAGVMTHDTLVKMAKAIPSQDPISIKLVGAQQFHNPGVDTINLSYEYQFPSEWLLINVATEKKGGVSTIVGFHVASLSDSLEHLNKFTLTGKSFLQYATWLLAILIPFFILYAFVLCIRTRIEKKKWLWLIFILFGIGKFTIDWTTNQWNFVPLNILLFGSGSFGPPYGAWLISISLPLGAIVFLFRRKSMGNPAPSIIPAA